MTQRYLEGMAAGCLILGTAPKELIELFQYNPVIEVDWCDPLKQVEQVLASIDDYQSLVNRNFRQVSLKGDWKQRAILILDYLKETE
jgi:hypothetical protein